MADSGSQSGGTDSVTVDVIVPTNGRHDALGRCLRALAEQTRPADRVLVVARADDFRTHEVVVRASSNGFRPDVITVDRPGVIAAMKAGVRASTGNLVAFTDDDARPRPDWLARITALFSDPAIGAVGGRDQIPGQDHATELVVGVFLKSGKLIGNHHLGCGPPRDVDVLKGVNMAFRSEALALPADGTLRGKGAQVDHEAVPCGYASSHGWRLVYDPAIVVDHEGSPRAGGEQRDHPSFRQVVDAAFNAVVAPSMCRPERLAPIVRFGFVVGTRDQPGAIRSLAAILRREPEVLRRAVPSTIGKALALSRWRDRRSAPGYITAADLRSEQAPRRRLILVAHDGRGVGGMEHVFGELVRRLHENIDLVVVTSSLDDELVPLVEWHRVPVMSKPAPLKFAMFFSAAGAAIHRIRRPGDLVETFGAIVPNRVDLIDLHFCHAGYRRKSIDKSPRPLFRRANTAVMSAMALAAERWSYRRGRAKVFVAVSAGVGDEASQAYPGIRVVTLPNGVDADRFRPDHAMRSAVRAHEGVESSLVGLFVGGDWGRKGLDIAIGAVAIARERGTSVTLWVVGDGDVDRFQRLADDRGAGDALRFFGRRPDPAPFYQAADAFVFPTSYEALSLSMLEAAASGLPLLVPAVNGADELVGDDEGGFILRRNETAFADALALLDADPQRRRALGAAARTRIAPYTWDRVAAAHLQLCCDLSGR